MTPFDSLKAASVAQVAHFLGVAGVLLNAIDQDGRVACPLCKAVRRSRSDPRSPLNTSPTDRGPEGWTCRASGGCGAMGDPLDFAAYALCGERFGAVDSEGQSKVAEFWEQVLQGTYGTAPADLGRAAGKATPPPEGLSPFAESLLPVTEDPEVSAYLVERGIDPAAVVHLGLAAALPAIESPATAPAWARARGPWATTALRLMLALYSAAGRFVSVRARRIDDSKGPKAATPAGYTTSGLLLVNAQGRTLLDGTLAPLERLSVVIVEGDTDFLAAATSPEWENYPIIGVTAGSWTPELVEKVPSAAVVAIWTHSDNEGEKYATEIVASLPGRIVRRYRLPTGEDIASLHAKGRLPAPFGDAYLVVGFTPPPSESSDETNGDTSTDSPRRPLGYQAADLDAASRGTGEGGWLRTPPPPRSYLLSYIAGAGCLPCGIVGLVAGEGGVSKTQAVVQLALAVASGMRWLDTLVVRAPGHVALVVAEEDIEEVRRRLFHAAQVMGLPEGLDASVLPRVRIFAMRGEAVALIKRARRQTSVKAIGSSESTASRETTEEWEPSAFFDRFYGDLDSEAPDEGWSLIVLDPLSRFAGVDTEADNYAATRFIAVCEKLLRLPGSPTVLLTHHSSKSARQTAAVGTDVARGVTALTDGVRWVATLTHVRKPGGEASEAYPDLVRLTFGKTNYSVRGHGEQFKRDPLHEGALRPLSDEERERLREDRENAKPAKGKKSAKKQPLTPGPPPRC